MGVRQSSRATKFSEHLVQLSGSLPAIRQGETVRFDIVELERLNIEQTLLDQISPAAVWGAVFRFFNQRSRCSEEFIFCSG